MESRSSYTRSEVLIWGLLILMGIFVLRLFYLQIIQHDFYVAEANKIQIQPLTIQPERGELYVYDQDELVPLVLNERVYTVFADPAEIKDPGSTKTALQRIIGGELVENVEELLDDPSGKIRYSVIARNVSRTQAEKIEQEQLRGIGLIFIAWRFTVDRPSFFSRYWTFFIDRTTKNIHNTTKRTSTNWHRNRCTCVGNRQVTL